MIGQLLYGAALRNRSAAVLRLLKSQPLARDLQKRQSGRRRGSAFRNFQSRRRPSSDHFWFT